MVGAFLFGLGAWIRWEKDFEKWIDTLEFYSYWYGVYVLLVAGIIAMLGSLLGCSGAVYERQQFLTAVSNKYS